MKTVALAGAGTRWSGLMLGIVLVGLVWVGLFPRLLRLGPIERHVDRMERLGVNPAAMYYTELDRLPLRPAWLAERLVLWPSLSRPPADVGHGAPSSIRAASPTPILAQPMPR